MSTVPLPAAAAGCDDWRREHRADLCEAPHCGRCQYLRRASIDPTAADLLTVQALAGRDPTPALDHAQQAVAAARQALLAHLAAGTHPSTAPDLVDPLIAAVRRLDAETVRELSRHGYSAQEAAHQIWPASRTP
jgi:hypothetical protein